MCLCVQLKLFKTNIHILEQKEHNEMGTLLSRASNEIGVGNNGEKKQEVKVTWQKAPHGGQFPG